MLAQAAQKEFSKPSVGIKIWTFYPVCKPVLPSLLCKFNSIYCLAFALYFPPTALEYSTKLALFVPGAELFLCSCQRGGNEALRNDHPLAPALEQDPFLLVSVNQSMSLKLLSFLASLTFAFELWFIKQFWLFHFQSDIKVWKSV